MNDIAAPDRILPERGLVADMPAEEYHRLPSISSGGLKRLLVSPAHYQEFRRNPPAPSAQMQLGTVLHTAVLEPHRLSQVVAVIPADAPSGRSKAATDWRDQFVAANSGKIILDAEQWERIEVMARNILATDAAAEFLAEGQVETTVVWNDDGIACRARPDFLVTDRTVVVDLKTARSAARADFARAVWEYRYDIQAAWYIDGLTIAIDFMPAHFLWCVVEPAPPHAVAWYRAEPDVINVGRRDCTRAMDRLRRCIERNEWPAYTQRIQPLSLPAWARKIDAADLTDDDQ